MRAAQLYVLRRPHRLRLHRVDEALDALVHALEGVLAEHRALGLVVQLEVHPVDRVVAPRLLRPAHEVTTELCPGGLRRDHRRLEDLSLIHISEPTRLGMRSYAVFCLKKKTKKD